CIDETQLHYMLSRGISRKVAQSLILQGFLQVPITEWPGDVLQKGMQNSLNKAVNGITGL
ncbi:MAG: Fe-S cluster assembly protein SufD, partial [Pseudomonadota bacterium]